MSLPFALRSRISLHEETRRPPRVRVPKIVGPILAYWSAMAALAYGVSSGALRFDEWFWPKDRETAEDDGRYAPEQDDAPLPPRVVPAPDRQKNPSVDEEPAEAPLVAAVDPSPSPLAAPSLPNASVPPLELEDEHPRALLQDAPGIDGDRERDLPVRMGTREAQEGSAPVNPPEGSANVRAADEKRTVLAMREPPAPHGTWSEPSFFGPSSPGTSKRVVLRSPGDGARGSRHLEDGAWLFAGDPPAGTTTSRPPIALRSVLPDTREQRAPVEEATAPLRAAANVGTCEAAAAAANEVMDLTQRGRGAPDVTADAYSNLLSNGRYLAPCGAPASMRIDVCAAVRDGRAVGVTVSTTPRMPAVAACVKRAVTRLSFPVSPRLDVTRTRFDAAR